MIPQLQVIENDIERDRKTCVKLFASITGANRELAQWLLDHPRYSAAQVAEWLGCGASRTKDLRSWAQSGFPGNSPWSGGNRRHVGDAALESRDNSEDDEPANNDTSDSNAAPDNDGEFAPPEEVKKNILDSIERQKAITLAYKKVLKSPSLDHESGNEVSSALGGLITILQSLQRTLASRRKNEH